jgi:hypothetical protein
VRGQLALCALALPGCGIFAGKPPQPPNVLRPLPAPRVSVGELDGMGLLGEVPARAARLGAGAPALVAAAQAVDNAWIGAFVEVPRDDCMLAYARGSSSIGDLDVAVYSEEGASLAVDEGRDVHPTVVLCAPHPDRVYVAAHVVEGEGLVAVGAQLVPRERAIIVARALGARGTIGMGPRPADAWPGLEEAVRTHRVELGGNWEEFRRVALPVDARVPTYTSVSIDAEQCLDAVVVPDEDIALLDVEISDGEGRVVARAKEGIGPRALTVCSPMAMTGTLAVRPHVGRGLAAVALARADGPIVHDLSTRPEIAWIATAQPLDTARSVRNTLLAKRGYSGPASTVSGALVLGRRTGIPLELKSFDGACARVDVVAGAPLALVDASIWSDRGALLASGQASASLALFACARGSARLELETRGRPGPFSVTVRPERWKDPVLFAHPLAASRMIARAAAGADMLLDGNDGAMRELSLEAARVATWNGSVPAGKCLRVTVGVQGEGAGVELRAVEGVDTELDRAEAAYAATVRACAQSDQGPRAVRFEARASAGRLDGIAGERFE